ncbi:hypothetical protein SAY86_031449 [Trapa natans]|uniref:Uncharacterized protein n=1 Tax=Trapa natans TaxID=22666 RepID=A0AAN7LR84_TRANT|nr:hypothetical protein SAY86_031449 [Trapa natans]
MSGLHDMDILGQRVTLRKIKDLKGAVTNTGHILIEIMLGKWEKFDELMAAEPVKKKGNGKATEEET